MMSEELARAVAMPPPTRSRVWRAWALTVAGLCDRTGKEHYDPAWWSAWISTTARPWYRGCRAMAPFSREARQRTTRRVGRDPRIGLAEALEVIPATREAVIASWKPQPDGTWVMDDFTAADELDRLVWAVEWHADWLNRRLLPLRDQVELLVLLDTVRELAHPGPNKSLITEKEK